MSWFVTVQPHPSRDETLSAIDHAESHDDLSDEAVEQLRVAKEAAKELIGKEVVGTGGPVGVMLSGHANPDHKRQQGVALESLSVTLTEADHPDTSQT